MLIHLIANRQLDEYIAKTPTHQRAVFSFVFSQKKGRLTCKLNGLPVCRQKRFYLNFITKLIGAEGARLLREKRV